MFALRKINKIDKINVNIFTRFGNLKQNMITKSYYSNKIPDNKKPDNFHIFSLCCGTIGGIIGFGYGFCDICSYGIKNNRLLSDVLLTSFGIGIAFGACGFVSGYLVPSLALTFIPIAIPIYILYKL